MQDFNYYAPTQVVFGEHSEEKVAELIKHHGGHKVLVLVIFVPDLNTANLTADSLG